MRVLTARRVAGCAAAASVALAAVAAGLAYLDRHLVPGRLAVWGFSYVFGAVLGLAVPAVGFVLASRRPGNRIGWLFNWIWVVPLATLALVLLIFPTRHLRSPRWRLAGDRLMQPVS